jgi:hypothetical protein
VLRRSTEGDAKRRRCRASFHAGSARPRRRKVPCRNPAGPNRSKAAGRLRGSGVRRRVLPPAHSPAPRRAGPALRRRWKGRGDNCDATYSSAGSFRHGSDR